MERSKTTEQGVVLTKSNDEPGVIQVEYQSQIIGKLTGTIKHTNTDWTTLVEIPKNITAYKLPPIITNLFAQQKKHKTLQQAITSLDKDIKEAETWKKAWQEEQQNQKDSMNREMDEVFGTET